MTTITSSLPSSSSSTGTAIVPYIPTPSFIYETNPSLRSFCVYNPYAVLGIPTENIDDLFRLVSGYNHGSRTKNNGNTYGQDEEEEEVQRRIQQRKQRIQDVYRCLANMYHPDKYNLYRQKKLQKMEQTKTNVPPPPTTMNTILQAKDQNITTGTRGIRRRPRPVDIENNTDTLLRITKANEPDTFCSDDSTVSTVTSTLSSSITDSWSYTITPVYNHELYSWIPIEERFAAINNAAYILRDLSLTLQYFSLKYHHDSTDPIATVSSRGSVPDDEKFYQILNLIQMRQALEYRHSISKIIEKLRYDMVFNHPNDGLLILLGLYGDLSSLPVPWIDPTIEPNNLPYYWKNITKENRNNPSSFFYRSSNSTQCIPFPFISTLDSCIPSSSVIDVTSTLQSLVEINHQSHRDYSSMIPTPNHKQVSLLSSSSSSSSSPSSFTTNPIIQLSLSSGSKSNGRWEGFFDPCNNYPKALLIRYYFLGKIHQCIIDDEQEVKIPLRKHTVTKNYMNNLLQDSQISKTLRNHIGPYLLSRPSKQPDDKSVVTMSIVDLQNMVRQYYQCKEEIATVSKTNNVKSSSASSPLSPRAYSQSIVQASTPRKEEEEHGNDNHHDNDHYDKDKVTENVPYTMTKTTKKVRIIRSPLTAARNNDKLNQLRTVTKTSSKPNVTKIVSSSIDPVSKTIRFDPIVSSSTSSSSTSSTGSSFFFSSTFFWSSCVIGIGSLMYYHYSSSSSRSPYSFGRPMSRWLPPKNDIIPILYKYTTILTDKMKIWYNGYIVSLPVSSTALVCTVLGPMVVQEEDASVRSS